MCVNATREKQSNLWAQYNHSQFHLLFGRISPWILLSAYTNREINMSSWWLLISFPSMLIYAPFNTRLQHPQWLKFSWIRSSSFMACHTLLFMILTQLSQAIFGWELFKIQGTELHPNTAYHPQTDGQTEVVNKCLETYLRCFASEKKNQWAQWLPLA
jgi:hypothetical protein